MQPMKRKILSWMFSALFVLATTPSLFAVEVGDKAPDFELVSTKDGKFKLSNLQGKKNILVQFYVLDFTPT